MCVSKACPRCSGDLFEERTLDGREVRCLQCGCQLNESEIATVEAVKRQRVAGPVTPHRYPALRAA